MRKKLNCLSIILLLLIGCVYVNWCFKLVSFKRAYNDGEFSVLSYNIRSLAEGFENNATTVARLIIREPPDFIYLTEFYEGRGNVLDTLLRYHYPYSYTKHRWGNNEGDAFYSKWKIDSVMRFFLQGTERIMAYRVRISHEKDTMSCYCLHLSTNNKNGKFSVATIQEGKRKRLQEVYEILKTVNKDPYPRIIMGDMNDISGSSSLNLIEEAGFKDAWWEGGFGYGCTYHGYDWPTKIFKLRIDHIMYDRSLELCSIEVIHSDLSDHDAIKGSFNLIRKE